MGQYGRGPNLQLLLWFVFKCCMLGHVFGLCLLDALCLCVCVCVLCLCFVLLRVTHISVFSPPPSNIENFNCVLENVVYFYKVSVYDVHIYRITFFIVLHVLIPEINLCW